MNAQEFKAWFAGYTEGKETLGAEQFARVCAEVAKMTVISISQSSRTPTAWPLTLVQNSLPTPAYVSCDPPDPHRIMY